MNILYLDDFINIYSNKLKKIIIRKPYKETLNNGRIIDKNKFIRSFLKLKEENNLNNNLLNESMLIITSSVIKSEDKILLKDTMEELNYKNIKFINELEILKIDKKILFINFNYSYFYIYSITENGKIKISLYENDAINKSLILKIINLFNKEKIIITGKNSKEIINILKNTNFNYYYFEEANNLFINMYLKN